jgi:ubiquitin-protein ligase
VWQDGVFQVYLKFESTYNLAPPQVFFQTIPFHPNIDIVTGKPSVDFLDEPGKWRHSYTIRHILIHLQHLLAYPFLDRAVNMDAVFLLKDQPLEYEKIIKQSILATKRIREILKSQKNDNYLSSLESQNDLIVNPMVASKISNSTDALTRFPLFKINNSANKRGTLTSKQGSSQNDDKYTVRDIAFDDYTQLWLGIATTKAMKDEENPYLNQNLLNNPNLLAQHISISLQDLEEQVYRQLSEHRNVMYGRFNFEANNKTSSRVGSAKRTIAPPKPRAVNYNSLSKHVKNFSPVGGVINSKKQENQVLKIQANVEDVGFEQEVDELVNWTKNI